jgi:hypothetical protein
MQNSNDTKRGGSSAAGAKDPKDRSSEAVSNKTLSDIEETENVSSVESPGHDPGPSPDGLLDEPDEIKDAGPM